MQCYNNSPTSPPNNNIDPSRRVHQFIAEHRAQNTQKFKSSIQIRPISSALPQLLRQTTAPISSHFRLRDMSQAERPRRNPAAMQNAIEPMQVDVPQEDNENLLEEENFVVENATLDLESYANAYTGFMRINRLIFIADHCPQLRQEALKMAITYVMTTYNVNMYQLLHKKVSNALAAAAIAAAAGNNAGNNNGAGVAAAGAAAAAGGAGAGGAAGQLLPDVAAAAGGNGGGGGAGAATSAANEIPPFDGLWLETRNKKSALKLEKLDNDLKNYKSNSIKESIRRGHDDLGDHYLSTGDLGNALKCYSRARDYCTSGKHVVNMCLNVIKVSVCLQNWAHVLSYVAKAEGTPEFADTTAAGGSSGGGSGSNGGGSLASSASKENGAIVTRLKCSAGLAELVGRQYKQAAKLFLQANIDHCDFPDLMSPNNVAVYGGLCALATFDRQELQKHVIGSSSFKLFLELEPQVRDIIHKFYESKYAMCLRLLEEIKDNLRLDVYIAAHVQQLYTQIRNRALIQYFSPYLSADMERMAVAFNRTVPELEDEVMQLILDGQIQARIDSHNKVLYAKDPDQRRCTFEKALLVGREYQRRTKMLILRQAMLKHNIHVKSHPREITESCPATGSNSNFRN